MDTIPRLAKNTGWIILGNLIQIAIGIITVASLARYLGSEDFGKYSFIFAYLGFFGIITDLGINTILVREISRDRARAAVLIGNTIIIKLLLSLLAIILSYLVIIPLKSSVEIRMFVFIAALTLLFSFGSVYRIIFQVNLKMFYPTAINILDNLIKLALFIWIIVNKGTLTQFIFVSVICLLPGLFTIMYFSDRLIVPDFKINFGIWRYLFKESWPIALTAIFITIYTRIDQLMLFQMKGAKAVGYYAAAVKLTELFNIIPAAFMTSIFPLFSKYFVTSQEKLEKAYKLSFKYLSTAIIPIAVGISILSEPTIRLIYGEQFLGSSLALRILIWSEVFVFLGSVHISILISVGLQKLDFIFTSSGAIVNIILNLLLIPHYGIVGASIATVISYGLGVPISCSLRKTRKYGMAFVYSTLKPFLAAIFMGFFTYLTLILRFPLVLIILYSLIIYFGFIVLIRGLDKQDLGYLNKILVRT